MVGLGYRGDKVRGERGGEEKDHAGVSCYCIFIPVVDHISIAQFYYFLLVNQEPPDTPLGEDNATPDEGEEGPPQGDPQGQQEVCVCVLLYNVQISATQKWCTNTYVHHY